MAVNAYAGTVCLASIFIGDMYSATFGEKRTILKAKECYGLS
ncbi:hypothetical protein [Candidatus Nitrotoga fabula]|nr:hypothetical protein [Candidatus Nitrotoga fabula]